MLPDDATDIIKNLVFLYKSLEEMTIFPPEICTRVLNCINHLSFQNTAPIRLQMKDAGLFSIRDSFVLYLLRCAPIPVLAEFISYFSFESITDQHKFRDAGGILYLLAIFHATHPDINLQAAVGIIIRDVLSHIDDNKKIISKYIDDPEVVENLFRSPVDNTKQKNQRISESESDALESIGIEEFIKWYYAEERNAKREAVEAKIQKQLSPQDLNFKSKQEKKC